MTGFYITFLTRLNKTNNMKYLQNTFVTEIGVLVFIF